MGSCVIFRLLPLRCCPSPSLLSRLPPGHRDGCERVGLQRSACDHAGGLSLSSPTSSWPHIEPFSVDVLALGLGAGGRASFFALSPSAAVLPNCVGVVSHG